MVVRRTARRSAVQVFQRVVHPPQVPLEVEAESTIFDRMGHLRPRMTLLCDHHRRRQFSRDSGVQLANKRNRFRVLVSPLRVRSPLAGLSREVEAQHAGDRVHPQPINVKLVQPIERIGNEEVPDLGTTKVEHVGAPIGMLAELRIGVFIQRRAIETRKTPLVLREMRGHPIDDHADAAFV